MQNMTAQDWAGIISQIPNIPQNQALISALQKMQQQASVFTRTYFYPLTFLALAVGATSVQSVNVDASGDFLCTEIHVHSDTGAAQAINAVNMPNATIQIQDQSSSQAWMPSATALDALCSNAMLVRQLPQPQIIRAKGGINVTLTSTETSATPNIYLTFRGLRIYSVAPGA